MSTKRSPSADPESNALWDLGLIVVTLAAVGYGGKRLFDYVARPRPATPAGSSTPHA